MPVSPDLLITFVLASITIAIVPGPAVSVIVANSIAHGSRAGWMNIAGTQVGLIIIIGVLIAGLATIVETMSIWFGWVRIIGAIYLVWLGLKLILSAGAQTTDGADVRTGGGFFWQGLFVILTNPKVYLFFGAFLPQFVDPAGDYKVQTLFLGIVYMIVALVSDGTYAALAGKAGGLLSAGRSKLAHRFSGSILVGGGVWLASIRNP